MIAKLGAEAANKSPRAHFILVLRVPPVLYPHADVHHGPRCLRRVSRAAEFVLRLKEA